MVSLAEALGVLPLQDETSAPTPPEKQTAKVLSRAILNSREYRDSLMRRITTDCLPAAVECKLYDYAYGKPIERVEIKDTSDTLERVPLETIERRIQYLGETIRLLRAKEAVKVEPQSVH